MAHNLILEQTEVAQWHSLVKEAEQQCSCQLDESMESYLIFTLMRFMKDQNLASQAMAVEYLRSNGLPKSMRVEQLRDIGDQCLLLSGLYPQRAEKRLVRVSYYVNMGRSAYHHISDSVQKSVAELYRQLAEAFITLMDLLQAIRDFNAPALQPIQSLELWSDTGSRAAYQRLSAQAVPLHEALIDHRIKQ